MLIHGRPGAYATVLARRAGARALARTAAGLAFLVMAWFLLPPLDLASLRITDLSDLLESGILLPAVLALTGAITLRTTRSPLSDRSKALVGVRSERRVARVLASGGLEAVIHGALLADRGGDADHVVLGPVCAVVETKTGRGRVSYQSGTLTAGRRQVPGDPVRQARRQADLLGRRARAHADAVVCVVDMENDPFQSSGTWVCSLKDLPRVLNSLPRSTSRSQARQIFRALVD